MFKTKTAKSDDNKLVNPYDQTELKSFFNLGPSGNGNPPDFVEANTISRKNAKLEKALEKNPTWNEEIKNLESEFVIFVPEVSVPEVSVPEVSVPEVFWNVH
jgi:hypothetical protein